jgi:hypothetical protein
MTKLNQIIAVEKGTKNLVNRDITDLYHELQKTPIMSGISRTYRPRDEEGEQLPPEQTNVQVRVPEVLERIAETWTRLFDIVLTKDAANMVAKADVVVDGNTLAEDVPVPFLLYFGEATHRPAHRRGRDPGARSGRGVELRRRDPRLPHAHDPDDAHEEGPAQPREGPGDRQAPGAG